MTADALALIDEAAALGVALELADRGRVRVAPASKLPPELRQRLAVAKPALLKVLEARAAGAGRGEEGKRDDAAALERGRKLLRRLQWTGRHVVLDADGALVIRPRLGTTDPFGQAVAAHPDDIGRALLAEAAGERP